MVKVFTPNKNGKIEFTKQELETLLNEVWDDGYNHHGTYLWTPPTITTPYYRTADTPITICCGEGTSITGVSTNETI